MKQFLRFRESHFILYMWFWNWDCLKKLLIFLFHWRLENITIINHNNFAFRKCNKKKVELLSLVIWTVFSDHNSAEKEGMKVWPSCKATKLFEIKYVCLFFFTNAFVQCECWGINLCLESWIVRWNLDIYSGLNL